MQTCVLKLWPDKEKFPGYEMFSGYGRSGIKLCRNPCINTGCGNFTGYGNFTGFGSKHYTQYILKPLE